MLVLQRKKNESIVVSNDVVITIIEVRGDKVRVGVSAPNDIPVHRKEVYDAIRRESDGNNDDLLGESRNV